MRGEAFLNFFQQGMQQEQGFSLVPLGDNENPPRCNERPNDMPAAKLRASTILRAFHEAEAQLVGKAVVLCDGKAGTVEIVSLDEDHGLRISIGGHVGSWPISTIKFAQS
jgi:hypothetical protein